MKLRKLLLLAFVALPLYSFAQDIVQAEYFVDADPGAGNGSTLFITANNQIDENIELNTALLSAGRHFLYVRVKDDQGVWSIYLRGMFYVTEAPGVNEITDIEYFFDEDPGVLSNSGVSVESGSTINSEQEIPTDTLSAGIHFLYARAKDRKGIWSPYLRKRIQIFENIQPEPIIAYEYAFDSIPQSQPGLKVDIEPLYTLDSAFDASIDGLSLGTHSFNLRVASNSGKWSTYFTSEFQISDCEAVEAPSLNEAAKINNPLVIALTGQTDMVQEASAEIITSPTKGTSTIDTDGNIEYLASQGFVGLDSIEYRLCNSCGSCDSAWVKINIANVAPEAADSVFVVGSGQMVYLNLQDLFSDINDNLDPESFAISLASNDIVEMFVSDPYEIEIDLTNNTFEGTTEFAVRICDDSGECVEQTYALVINLSECEEVIAPSFNELVQIDDPLVIALAGQTDMVQEANAEIITSPIKGTASINIDGNIEYLASKGFVGLDSIKYRLCNSCGSCDSAWVKIDIANVAPEAADSVFVVRSGRMVNLNLQDLFSDVNDNLDPESFAISLASNDIAEMFVSDPYEIVFDLAGNVFEGTTEFTVTVCDHAGSCAEKTYTLVIEMEGEEPGEEITIYNAISPNGDGLNDFMEIQYIDQHPDNQFVVFDRWGSKVFEIDGYNNSDRRFEGNRNVGGSNLLPTGTYYYQLHIEDLSKDYRGFIIIKTYDHEKVNLTN